MGNNGMHDALDVVERLAARARQETPQPIPVAADVVRRLRVVERSPLAWMAACAVALTVMAITALALPGGEGDPLEEVFEAASFVQSDGGI